MNDNKSPSLLEYAFQKIKNENDLLHEKIDTISNVELKKKEELLNLQSAALEASANAIVITDVNANINWANSAFAKLTGYTKDEVYNQNPRVLKSGLHDDSFYKKLWETVSSGNIWHGEVVNKKKDGTFYTEEMTITPLKNEDGEVTNYIAIKQDISATKAAREIEQLILTEDNLDDLLSEMHQIIKKVLQASNCYIALLEPNTNRITFPYFADEHDEKPAPRRQKRGLTEYVIRTGKPLKLTPEIFRILVDKREIDPIGTIPVSWIGIPLFIESNPLGVLVVQSYDKNFRYTDQNCDWLMSIGSIVSTAIQRKQNEKRIAESEAKYREMTKSARDGIVSIHRTGEIIEWNEAATKLFGYTREEVIGTKLQSILIPDESLSDEVERFKDLLEGKLGDIIELHVNNKNNENIIVELSAAVTIVHKKLIITGIFRDITNRRKAENELKDSHYKFRKLIENSTLGIIRLDENGEIIMANPAMVAMLDYNSESELVTKVINRVYASSNGRNKFLQILKNEQRITGYEDVLYKSDGSVIDVKESAWGVKDRNDKIIYYEVIVEDISEQNQVLKILHESEFKYRMLIDKLSEAVFLIIGNKIEVANSKFMDILKITEEELYSSEFNFKNYITAEGKEILEDREKMIKNGEDISKVFELTIINKSEEEKEVEISVSYLTFKGNTATQGVMRDLTDVRKQETQIRHLQKMEAIGTLASGIAHEINTPSQFVNDNLTFLKDTYSEIKPILDFSRNIESNKEKLDLLTQLVEETDLEYLQEEIPSAINQSIDGVQRIAEIVGAMRDFAHSGPKDKISANLHNIINNSITLSKNAWKYIAEIENDFDESNPNIICQPNDLNQVFVNMIVNSSHALENKFGESETIQGKIKIQTFNREENVEINVIDNGAGMPDRVIKRIFDPFYTTKDVGKGTGQGLAIAHDIVVTKHKGTIEVTSEEGIGTTFKVFYLWIKTPILLSNDQVN